MKTEPKKVVRLQLITALVAFALVVIAMFTPWLKVKCTPLTGGAESALQQYVVEGYGKKAITDSEFKQISEKIYNANGNVEGENQGYTVSVSPINFLFNLPNSVKALINCVTLYNFNHPTSGSSINLDTAQKIAETPYTELSPKTVDDLYLMFSIVNIFDSGESDSLTNVLADMLLKIFLFLILLIVVLIYAITMIIALIKNLIKIKELDQNYQTVMKKVPLVYYMFGMYLCFKLLFSASSISFGGILLWLAIIAVTAVNITAIYLKPFNANQKKYAMLTQAACVISALVITILFVMASSGKTFDYFTSAKGIAEIMENNIRNYETMLLILVFFKTIFFITSALLPLFIASRFIKAGFIKESAVDSKKSSYVPIEIGFIVSLLPFISKAVFKCSLPSECATMAIGMLIITVLLIAVEVAKSIIAKKIINVTSEECSDLYNMLPTVEAVANEAPTNEAPVSEAVATNAESANSDQNPNN